VIYEFRRVIVVPETYDANPTFTSIIEA